MTGQVKNKQLIPTAFGIADGKEVTLASLNTAVNSKMKTMGLVPAVSSACNYLYTYDLKAVFTTNNPANSPIIQSYRVIVVV